jgi:hypothetical protein
LTSTPSMLRADQQPCQKALLEDHSGGSSAHTPPTPPSDTTNPQVVGLNAAFGVLVVPERWSQRYQ